MLQFETRAHQDSTAERSVAYKPFGEIGRKPEIATPIHISPARSASGLSLAFSAGHRPTADDIARLAQSLPGPGGFSISHRPKDTEGWVELLVNGLTFDLSGLTPAGAEPTPTITHRIGLKEEIIRQPLEAITLRAGPHLAGGEHLLPVVRAMAAVGAALAGLPDVVAVSWHPAANAVRPDHFTRSIAEWIGGGAFPALALTALYRDTDNNLCSAGLKFLTSQELRLDSFPGESPAQGGKIAVRLIHQLVERGMVTSACDLTGPGGERLRAEPSADGHILRIWRGN